MCLEICVNQNRVATGKYSIKSDFIFHILLFKKKSKKQVQHVPKYAYDDVLSQQGFNCTNVTYQGDKPVPSAQFYFEYVPLVISTTLTVPHS
jgi:hypothetical protein